MVFQEDLFLPAVQEATEEVEQEYFLVQELQEQPILVEVEDQVEQQVQDLEQVDKVDQE
jgi:hypothetical protein